MASFLARAYHAAGRLTGRNPSDTETEMLTLLNEIERRKPQGDAWHFQGDSSKNLTLLSTSAIEAQAMDEESKVEGFQTIDLNASNAINHTLEKQSTEKITTGLGIGGHALRNMGGRPVRIAARKLEGHSSSLDDYENPGKYSQDIETGITHELILTPVFIRGNRDHTCLLAAQRNWVTGNTEYHLLETAGSIRGRFGKWLYKKSFNDAIKQAIDVMGYEKPFEAAYNLPKIKMHYTNVQKGIDDTQCGFWTPTMAKKLVNLYLDNSADLKRAIKAMRNNRPTVNEAAQRTAAGQSTAREDVTPKISYARAFITLITLFIPLLIQWASKKNITVAKTPKVDPIEFEHADAAIAADSAVDNAQTLPSMLHPGDQEQGDPVNPHHPEKKV